MRKNLFLIIILAAFFTSCKKEDDQDVLANEPNKASYGFDGTAQGPFVAGANITIIELDNNLNPTGKTFFSTVENNSGEFTIPNIQVTSPFIQLQVKGRQFNLEDGGLKSSEITLYSIVNLSSTTEVNVNIITHLIQARLKNLMSSGKSFKDAKNQAEKELLKVFSLDSMGISNSDSLNLVTNDINGGALLMITAIIQSNIGSGMAFQEFITNLQTDFKNDGLINSLILQRTLATSAEVLPTEKIETNLISYYSSIGLTVNPYDYKSLLKKFIRNANFPSMFDNLFPVTLGDTINLISDQDTIVIDSNKNYNIAILCPAYFGISSIQVAITTTDYGFISNASWYQDGNTKRLIKDMNENTDLLIPVKFSGSGKLTLELHIVVDGSGFVHYPIKTIIWN